MKILTCMLMVAASLAAQNTGAAPARPAAPAKDAKKAPLIVDIPKDAVQTTPGFYKWTDKDGKVWMYRRTPFGVSRRPYESTYDKHAVADERPTAVEEGDSVRFEQSSPFGKRVWLRKKSELTDNEQAIWASQQKASQQKNKTAGQTAEKE